MRFGCGNIPSLPVWRTGILPIDTLLSAAQKGMVTMNTARSGWGWNLPRKISAKMRTFCFSAIAAFNSRSQVRRPQLGSLRLRSGITFWGSPTTKEFLSLRRFYTGSGPKPKVYVINVDNFFDQEESLPAREITHDPGARSHDEAKRRWQRVHEQICKSVPAICGHTFAIFRGAKTEHSACGPATGHLMSNQFPMIRA